MLPPFRLGEKRRDNDPVKLRSKLNLRSAVAGDLFVGAWRARGSGERGLLYLVADGDLMPWQKPSRAVSFMWHRGAPLMVGCARGGHMHVCARACERVYVRECVRQRAHMVACATVRLCARAYFHVATPHTHTLAYTPSK